MAEINPWLSKPAAASEVAATATVSPVSPPSGPLAPQEGVPAPDQVDRLPLIPQRRTAALWCMGVHGGSGESSVSRLMPEWAEAGHGWPQLSSPTPAPVLLVARAHMRGLLAAQAAATQWAAGLVEHVDVLGLLIVADAPGRLPRPLKDFAHVVSGGVPRSWHLPWIEPWRLGEDLPPERAPREVRRLVDELVHLTTQNPNERDTK